MVGGTLRGDDMEKTILGVSPKRDWTEKSSFRMVSDEAVLVLAKTIPILADEMTRICFRRPEQIAAIKAEERRHKWQSRFENNLRGKWTFCPLYNPWMENGHCELNYYVTQFYSWVF